MAKMILSTNMNAYYPSPNMFKAYQDMSDTFNAYPTYENEQLDTLIFDFLVLDSSKQRMSITDQNTYFCNGTTEAFDFILRTLNRSDAAVFLPTYWGYEELLRQNKYYVTHYTSNDIFSNHKDTLDLIACEHEVIFICNPNNPTLSYLDLHDIQNLLIKHPTCHFIIDETMLIFDRKFHQKTCANLVAKHSNITVLISFSKIFAMGGLRAGAIISHKTTIDDLKAIRIPYSTPTLTQVMIKIALTDIDYLNETIQKISYNQTYLIEELKEYYIDCVYDNHNFILIKLLGNTTHLLYQYLLERNIILRDLQDTYPELNGEYLRITIGTYEQCQTLVQHIKNYFETISSKEAQL